MTNKEARKAVGKKIEEAYLSIPMGEAPSKETVEKWLAIADQRRAERRRRKKKIMSCAAALAICVCVGVACMIKPPSAVAGGSGGTKIETGLESSDIYVSQEELPNDIKEEFLLFPESPKNYVLKEVRVEKRNNIKALYISYENEDFEEFYIGETKKNNAGLISMELSEDAKKEVWEDIEVYITEYSDGDKEIIYMFVYNELVIKISTSEKVSRNQVKELVEKTVRE